MKLLGNILHLSNSGKLIARSSQSPPLGVAVFDRNKKKIGKIYNVFGPTKDPYVSIRLFKPKNFQFNTADELYFTKSTKKQRRRKHAKKKKN
ncbi:MAG: Gar1/Naf1 family protein [Methanobrevibacter sp.]|jgi:RNA-binding protein|nr:Gar1/Naf1 family protein [Methanobrevibacter sp.]